MKKFYHLAWQLSLSSDFPKKNFRMAAVAVRGGAIVSSAVNRAHSHVGYANGHAETRCLRPHQNFKGCTVYVARRNHRVSKPCDSCLKACVEAGVAAIVYINNEGRLTKEILR